MVRSTSNQEESSEDVTTTSYEITNGRKLAMALSQFKWYFPSRDITPKKASRLKTLLVKEHLMKSFCTQLASKRLGISLNVDAYLEDSQTCKKRPREESICGQNLAKPSLLAYTP
mmetsp:Transcript_20835/g.25636  ORF Transcript_20835/g.25636 Transcript_20835/m.25636 type:complete len:115 (+) Transcript_20835:225-569(+)